MTEKEPDPQAQAHYEGEKAGFNGDSVEHCPYFFGDRRAAWYEGFRKGKKSRRALATDTYAFTFSRGEVALLAAAMAAMSRPGAGLNPIGREVAARLRDGFVVCELEENLARWDLDEPEQKRLLDGFVAALERKEE